MLKSKGKVQHVNTSRSEIREVIAEQVTQSKNLIKLIEHGIASTPDFGEYIDEQISMSASNAYRAALSSMQDMIDKLAGMQRVLDDSLSKVDRTLTIQRPKLKAKKVEGLFHHKLPDLIEAISIGNPIWLTGDTQTGKGKAVEQAAEALGLKLVVHQFGKSQTSSKLSGFLTATGQYSPVSLYFAVKYGWLFLGDEADIAQFDTLIWPNNGLSNGTWHFPIGLSKVLADEGHEQDADELVETGGELRSHPNFRCVFAANTKGKGSTMSYQRNKVDSSTLARFDFVHWDYDEKLEFKLAEQYDHADVEDWVRICQLHRKVATDMQLTDVFVTTNHVIRGCKNLAAGVSRQSTYERSLLHHIPHGDPMFMQAVNDRWDADVRTEMESWYA